MEAALYLRNHLLGELVSAGLGMRFAVDADDGFGIGLAKMHPAVFEIDLHTINSSHLARGVGSILIGHPLKEGVNIHIGSKVLAVFRDNVFGISAAEFADLHFFLSKEGEEEGYAHESIATIVEFGVDDASVALATDDGIRLAHKGCDVDFTHGRSLIGAVGVAVGDIAEGARGRKVGDRVSGCVGKHVVGNRDKRVFFAEHFARLADECKTVDIGVDDDAQIAMLLRDGFGNLGEVLRDRLGIVGEVARRLAIEFDDVVYAKSAEQAGNSDSASRVDGIDGYAEVGFGYGFAVD